MKGIYKITNEVNGKSYIGKSSNIEERWKYHLSHYNCITNYDKPLYRAFRKYGKEHFSFEIIEIMNEDDYNNKSNEREIYWISYYNTYHFGYNATKGGDGGLTYDMQERFGKLTKEEVLYIRQKYAECIAPQAEIYNEFKDRITKRGFQAIWLGQNWKNIMPEIYTEENRKKHILIERQRQGVLRRRLSLDEIIKLRQRVSNGELISEIYKEYKDKYSYGGFRDVIGTIHPDERC